MSKKVKKGHTFSVTFDDISEGRVRCFVGSTCEKEAHFETYGQALAMIMQLREDGWTPLSPNVEAIETLLQTAHLYHLKAIGRG